MSISHTFIIYACLRTLKQVYWFNPVSGTLEYPMIHGSAIHIAYRILAAFFIDMGAKTSIVENLVFIQPFIYLYYFSIFVQIIKIISNFNYKHSVY